MLYSNIWRKLVFWVGDIRFIKHFPYITWDITEFAVSYEEITKALTKINAGDIGLHKWNGYLSNYILPGEFKHTWIHSTGYNDSNNMSDMKIVEATSEGINKNHAIEALYSDYFIILRPKELTTKQIQNAIKRAEKLSTLNIEYDVYFKFEIEDEIKLFNLDNKNTHNSTSQLELNCIKDRALSCSETVALCYYDVLPKLNIFRQEKYGKQIIEPMAFFNNHFKLIYVSSTINNKNINKFKFNEEQKAMLSKYWSEKHD